jgi:GAF domain-containing protein
MSHDLHIDSGVSKEEIYAQLLPQLTALTEGESDMIACMANLCAALHQTFGWLWTGFYRAKGDELVLGPFQGPLACVRIKRGKGVCGTAWIKEETIVVPDVEKFRTHSM